MISKYFFKNRVRIGYLNPIQLKQKFDIMANQNTTNYHSFFKLPIKICFLS